MTSSGQVLMGHTIAARDMTSSEKKTFRRKAR
jgi:hypothetical protein